MRRAARQRLGRDARIASRTRRIRSGGAASAGRPRAALHRRRQRAAAYRGDDRDADSRNVRPDAAGAVGALARPACRPSRSSAGPRRAGPAISAACVPGDFRCLTSIAAGRGGRSGRRRCRTGAARLDDGRSPGSTRRRCSAARLERVAMTALVGFVAALQLSMAAAQILLAITLASWWRGGRVGHERIQVPGMFWPLAAYGVATLVSGAHLRRPEHQSRWTASSWCCSSSSRWSTASRGGRAPDLRPRHHHGRRRERASSASPSSACSTSTTWASGRRARSATT